MGSLPNVSTATLRLLVAVYALMTPDDHRILYPVLWKQFLDESEIQVIESVRRHHHSFYIKIFANIYLVFVPLDSCFRKTESGSRRVYQK